MKYLAMLGAMALICASARLITYNILRLQDENKKPVLQTFLSIISFILYFLSAPISLILIFGIETLFQRRIDDKHHREILSLNSKHVDIVSDFRQKIEKLQDERIDTYFAVKDEGYTQGLRDGFRKGYREGYDDCLEEGPFTDEEKSKLKLAAMEYSIYLSSHEVANYKREHEHSKEVIP